MLTFQVDLYETVNRLENGYLVVDLRVKPGKPVGWAHAFTMRSNVTANTILSTLVCMHTVKQINSPVVAMVAWFTVVVEANCIRPPVSLLFPHSGIRIRGEKNKETTPLVVIASVWYQHKPSVVKTTLVEYARVSEFSTVQVLQWPKNLFALCNSEVSTFGSILKYCFNSALIGTVPSGHVSKVAAIGRCPLREVPLYRPPWKLECSQCPLTTNILHIKCWMYSWTTCKMLPSWLWPLSHAHVRKILGSPCLVMFVFQNKGVWDWG